MTGDPTLTSPQARAVRKEMRRRQLLGGQATPAALDDYETIVRQQERAWLAEAIRKQYVQSDDETVRATGLEIARSLDAMNERRPSWM